MTRYERRLKKREQQKLNKIYDEYLSEFFYWLFNADSHGSYIEIYNAVNDRFMCNLRVYNKMFKVINIDPYYLKKQLATDLVK